MKFFPIAFFTLLLLISACENAQIDTSNISEGDIDKVIRCDPPYIRYATGCCLDQNSNNICDKDEKTQDESEQEDDNENRGIELIVGEAIIVEGRTISLVSVASNNATRFSVNGVNEVIEEGKKVVINGVEITVLKIKYISNSQLRSVKIEAKVVGKSEEPSEDLPEYYENKLKAGESIIIEGRTVSLDAVSNNNASRVAVNGQSGIVKLNQKTTINGLEIESIQVHNEPGTTGDESTLRIKVIGPSQSYPIYPDLPEVFTMKEGESVTVEGMTISIVDIGSNGVASIAVDNEAYTLTEGQTIFVDVLEIKANEIKTDGEYSITLIVD